MCCAWIKRCLRYSYLLKTCWRVQKIWKSKWTFAHLCVCFSPWGCEWRSQTGCLFMPTRHLSSSMHTSHPPSSHFPPPQPCLHSRTLLLDISGGMLMFTVWLSHTSQGQKGTRDGAGALDGDCHPPHRSKLPVAERRGPPSHGIDVARICKTFNSAVHPVPFSWLQRGVCRGMAFNRPETRKHLAGGSVPGSQALISWPNLEQITHRFL